MNDLAGGIEHTDIMAAIAKIEAKGVTAGRHRGGGSENNGRSVCLFVCFHRQSV